MKHLSDMPRIKKIQWSILTKFVFTIGWVVTVTSFSVLTYKLYYKNHSPDRPSKFWTKPLPDNASSCTSEPANPFYHNPATHSHGMFDSSRQFQSHMFAIVADSWESISTGPLCLGSQTSVDRLHHVAELASTWSGPISISVFVPDTELSVASTYIRFLRYCLPAVANQVTFHLVYPTNHPGLLEDQDFGNTLLDCDQPKVILEQVIKYHTKTNKTSWREKNPYPQNLLRNIAKSGCQTNFTYIPDIDMVPGYSDMSRDLEDFLRRQEELVSVCLNCAYVIPTYEISPLANNLPRDKNDLVYFIKKGKARYFHKKVWKLNQQSSNLSKWERIPKQEKMNIAYKVDKFIFFYEPVYIARANAPPFDERFVGYGMTRNTQAYEMHMAGYSFHVLNNAFSSHWGFQSAAYPEWRKKQIKGNEKRFKGFEKEIKVRYTVAVSKTTSSVPNLYKLGK